MSFENLFMSTKKDTLIDELKLYRDKVSAKDVTVTKNDILIMANRCHEIIFHDIRQEILTVDEKSTVERYYNEFCKESINKLHGNV